MSEIETVRLREGTPNDRSNRVENKARRQVVRPSDFG